jgi:hypothetical protein
MNPLIQLKQTTSVFLVGFGLACFGLSPAVQAVSPAPDGGYPNFTTAEGEKALFSLSTGSGNTGLGWFSLFSDNTGSFNTGVGAGTLALNNGDSNTAVGVGALLLNTTGSSNTAMGSTALLNNTSGADNSAFGLGALAANTTGIHNTACGLQALFNNTTGGENTAFGLNALASNTTGTWNTAVGSFALVNATGLGNTGIGFNALTSTTTGVGNVAVGFDALSMNTTGTDNIAIGDGAGMNVTTGTNVICIGAGVAGSNSDSSCYIGNIFGHTVDPTTGTTAYIDTNGKLGTLFPSSRRFKHDVRPMDKASETLLALKPVTFLYNSDAKNTLQFGLIAEEVAAVNPNLVVRDKNGQPFTVRYDQVNAMLLNEFLKEHRKLEEQNCKLQQQGVTIARLEQQIDALTAGLQKVNAQLELSKPAPQTVLNNQ